ncbi:hypothetical protein NNO_0628 [Hydrogenimonas sp.]|nr:hypothetical protein NNO_0628 [Hydrogenimonas sp.]
MAYRIIKLRNSKIRPHKAFVSPEFDASTVLVADQFDYVELWLKRNSNIESVLFWQQSKNFYKASQMLPNESKTIASYYCMLNAAKALLSTKEITYSQLHGITGQSKDSRTSLANEISKIKGKGIFASLSKYFGADLSGKEVSLKDLLYNIPFVHRAYTVTYRGSQDLFIPIHNPHFVRQTKGSEAWFCAEIRDERFCSKKIFTKQRGWEIDVSQSPKFIIRRKRRFRWDTSRGSKKSNRISSLTKYHQKIRRDIKYIHGAQRLWYFKRNDREAGTLPWPTPALIFVAMHRLSELTRYDPKRLKRHFDCQHNWLLTEFINQATDNFIDQASSDITGHELMVPGYR